MVQSEQFKSAARLAALPETLLMDANGEGRDETLYFSLSCGCEVSLMDDFFFYGSVLQSRGVQS